MSDYPVTSADVLDVIRSLVFACSNASNGVEGAALHCTFRDADELSKMASDNHNEFESSLLPNIELQTYEQVGIFCAQFALWWPFASLIPWSRVGYALAGHGFDEYPTKLTPQDMASINRATREIWPDYEHEATWSYEPVVRTTLNARRQKHCRGSYMLKLDFITPPKVTTAINTQQPRFTNA